MLAIRIRFLQLKIICLNHYDRGHMLIIAASGVLVTCYYWIDSSVTDTIVSATIIIKVILTIINII